MPALAAEVGCVDLRRAPWWTATASAACHGGPPRAPPAGSSRGHHGRARGGVQRRWYPAPAVPTTCSTPHPRTPASRAASAAGIHGQERFELSYLGRGGSKWWTGSRVSSSAARLDVSPSRTVSQRLSESKSLRLSAPSVSPCMFWGSGMAPRWPASGDRRYYRFVRAWKFGSCHQYRSPLPSHTAPHPCISLEAATCIQLLRNRSCCIKPPAREQTFQLQLPVDQLGCFGLKSFHYKCGGR